MSWFKKELLGVDLGTRTLKGVKLTQEKDGRVVLSGHFFQDLLSTSENYPERVNPLEALRAALEVQKLKSSYAAAAIPDSEVLTFNLELPKMSEKELKKAVPVEVAEASNLPMEEHSCDFAFSPVQPDNNEVIAVRAYCVKKDRVLECMKSLTNAGLKPSAIESELMAATAMLEFNGYLNPSEVSMVIDLGEGHVTSGLISDGALALTRDHGVSLGKINASLMGRLGFSYEEAESLKSGYDFSQEPSNTAETQILDEEFTAVFKTIKAAIDFYRECPESYGRLDRIFLIGGGTQIKGIAKLHELIFKVPTLIANPFRNIDIFTKTEEQDHDEIVRITPFMATAVGLALGAVTKAGAA
jgi:type IV pilus assembly protein PilM